MKENNPVAIRREDYRPPPYTARHIDLTFELDPEQTRVTAVTELVRADGTPADAPLVLLGQHLQLVSASIDGQPLAPEAYQVDGESLTIADVPGSFKLTTVSTLNPSANKALEGLYVSSGNFCTQCEAEGFRRITWSLDRPDVMARYRTRLEADLAHYPVLLSNGNLVDSGELDGGRHYAVWEDPFPKPSYLFALVAGNLVRAEDTFTTRSGRKVDLHVYVQAEDLDQTGHCMASLKRAMRWDEEAFGREYDLDIYMIVAVRDFNMGAMENKGLNIFNTKYVLARADTATDNDFLNVESVVAHEYFHNWSGNRVTCRDWFQLSLKEGFTVYRDQEFSADVGSRALKRIQDVQRLQAAQFPEDAGPTAHPIRPDEYVEINNFYTATVYEKGAEVVRMLHTLLGAEGFRQGSDAYFDRHDGQAVTCEDFVAALEDSSGRDLTQFRRWYAQAGTPTVRAQGSHDAAKKQYTLTLSQRTPATPGQPSKQAMPIPVRLGLLGPEGGDLPLRLAGETSAQGTTRLLELTDQEQSFTFEDMPQRPTASLLRGFSAPVKLETDSTDKDLLLRMAHDSDPFNRWEASQTLAQRRVFEAMQAGQLGREPRLDQAFIDAFAKALTGDSDPALLAQALALPAETVLADRSTDVDPEAIHAARSAVRRQLAEALEQPLRQRYDSLSDTGPYSLEADAMGRRSLRNLCLSYLMSITPEGDGGLAETQFEQATNMTDQIAAMALLVHVTGPARERALASFYTRYEHEALVVDKWFATQAMSQRPDTLSHIAGLLEHPAFDRQNPNRVRALVDSFASANPLRFHAADGSGYEFLADRVLDVNAFNPQVASRLLTPLCRFARYEKGRRTRMVGQLDRIRASGELSADVLEQVTKALEAAR